MKVIIALLAAILCLSSCCCSGERLQETDHLLEKDKVKPYDPEKAKAVIADCFDITDDIEMLTTKRFENITLKTSHDLAEYNDCIYIRIKQTLYVFNKQTKKKEQEIFINFPQEYNSLPGNNSYLGKSGLAVIGSQAFVLLTDGSTPPYKSYLFNVNLDTGSAEYIDEETFGIKFRDGIPNMMGYDHQKNAIWFRIEEWNEKTSGIYICYFQYDANTKVFTKVDEAKWGLKINYASYSLNPPDTEDSLASIITTSIYGNESWSVYECISPRYGEERFFVTDKRNMDSLTEFIGRINVEHLGTLSLPQSIIYDKPYLWMMVEREGRIQMLKLLPDF